MDIKVRDSNGALLAEGDSVTLIKDLKLRGSSTVLKRGTMLWQQIISAVRPQGALRSKGPRRMMLTSSAHQGIRHACRRQSRH